MRTSLSVCCALLSLLSANLIAQSASQATSLSTAEQLRQAAQCAQMTQSRLARLSCFDAVFNTPLSTPTISPSAVQSATDLRPPLWHQVVAQERQRTASDAGQAEGGLVTGFIRNQASRSLSEAQISQGKADIIITQSAIGTFPPRPVLVFSCIDNITRLQLLMHSPIEEGVTPLSLLIDGKALPSRWFSEENGYLIRAGRGLPGIQDIKAMLHKKRLSIRSKTTEIDGLSFDLTALNAAISPLRQACHW